MSRKKENSIRGQSSNHKNYSTGYEETEHLHLSTYARSQYDDRQKAQGTGQGAKGKELRANRDFLTPVASHRKPHNSDLTFHTSNRHVACQYLYGLYDYENLFYPENKQIRGNTVTYVTPD